MVLLAHSREGFQIIPISEDANEGYDAWKDGEQQLFYYDDFLGQTNFAESLGKNEDSRLERFISRVKRNDNKHFILTTRDQIFRSAVVSSDRIRRIANQVDQETITIDDYDRYTKGLILFNHIYFSSLGIEDRANIINDGKYFDYIDHVNYSPRIVEQVLNRSNGDLATFYQDLENSLTNPQDLWIASYSGLSEIAQRILRLIISYPPAGANEDLLRTQLLGVEIGSYTQALRVLDGTWIRIAGDHEGETLIEFANPSCRDFIIHKVDSESILAEESVRNATTFDRLLLLRGYAYSLASNRSSLSAGQLARTFEKLGRKIIDRLKIYYHVSLRTSAPLKENRFLIPDPRPSMLQTILTVFRDFDEERKWIHDEIKTLVADGEKPNVRLGLAATDYLGLSRALADSGNGMEKAAASLLLGHAINHIDNFEDLSEFITLAEKQAFDIDNDEVRQLASEILEGEFQYFENDCTDASQIFEGANRIQNLAEKLGLDLGFEISTLREKAEETPEDNSSLSGPIYRPAPPDPDLSDRQAIHDLFRGLI